jgi:hypothetical protein
MTRAEKEVALENLYHDALKHLNKLNENPILQAVPSMREEITGCANSLIKLRDLTRETI